MILSVRESQIIAQIALHAEESLPMLARRAKVKIHTLRYTIDRLRERGLLKKRWVIDLMACGWQRYEIFFASSNLSKKNRELLIAFLKSCEQCTYLAEVGGDFDFELILLVRDSKEVKDFLAEVTARFGDLSFSKAIAHHHKVHYFPRKYLSSKPVLGVHSLIGYERKEVSSSQLQVVNLNQLDHLLLKNLSEDPEISQRSLAKICDCAPLTVQSRLQSLREKGVIRGAMYSFQAKELATQNYILLVYTKGFGAAFGQSLYDFCYRHPNCTNLKECFGSWDYEIGIEINDYQELLRIKEELIEKFPSDLHSLKLLARFFTHKFDFYPFREWRM